MKMITLKQNSDEVTVKEIFEEFIRYKALQNASPETIKYYKDCYRYFADFLGESAMCDEVSEEVFYNYIEYRLFTPNSWKGSGDRD